MSVPYKHKGRTLKDGLDCYGLILIWYKFKFGIELIDINEDYEKLWAIKGKNYFIENYHKQWIKVSEQKIDEVILYKNKRGIVNHGGICMGNDRFLHACRAGVVINRICDPQWNKRIDGYYRYVNKTNT